MTLVVARSCSHSVLLMVLLLLLLLLPLQALPQGVGVEPSNTSQLGPGITSTSEAAPSSSSLSSTPSSISTSTSDAPTLSSSSSLTTLVISRTSSTTSLNTTSSPQSSRTLTSVRFTTSDGIVRSSTIISVVTVFISVTNSETSSSLEPSTVTSNSTTADPQLSLNSQTSFSLVGTLIAVILAVCFMSLIAILYWRVWINNRSKQKNKKRWSAVSGSGSDMTHGPDTGCDVDPLQLNLPGMAKGTLRLSKTEDETDDVSTPVSNRHLLKELSPNGGDKVFLPGDGGFMVSRLDSPSSTALCSSTTVSPGGQSSVSGQSGRPLSMPLLQGYLPPHSYIGAPLHSTLPRLSMVSLPSTPQYHAEQYRQALESQTSDNRHANAPTFTRSNSNSLCSGSLHRVSSDPQIFSPPVPRRMSHSLVRGNSFADLQHYHNLQLQQQQLLLHHHEQQQRHQQHQHQHQQHQYQLLQSPPHINLHYSPYNNYNQFSYPPNYGGSALSPPAQISPDGPFQDSEA